MYPPDPCEPIDRSVMKMWQIAIIGVAVLLNAMDGFDICPSHLRALVSPAIGGLISFSWGSFCRWN